jgi:hypothetical protein
MMRLDQETDLGVHSADQRVQNVYGDVDDSLAVGALQMRVRRNCVLGGNRGQGEMVDRGRASDVGVRNEAKIAKRGQGAIDRSPMNPWSRCFGPGDDLVGGQVLVRAIEYLDDGLAGSGYPFVLIPQPS